MLWDRAWTSGETVGRMLDELPVAAVVLNPDREVTYVNQQFESLTRRLRSTVVGGTLAFLWGEESDDAAVQAMQSSFAMARPFRDIVRSSRGDRTEFWNRVALTPVRDRNGDVMAFMAFMEDVTKEVEERRAGSEHARTGRVLIAAAAAFAEASDREGVAAALAEAVVDGGAVWAAVVVESPAVGFRVNGVARSDDHRAEEPLPLGLVIEESDDLRQAMTLSRPTAVDQATATPRMLAWMQRNDLVRVLVSALPANASARALILAVWRDGNRAGEGNALDRIGRLAELAAIALENTLLVEQLSMVANRDELTGASSRTAFQVRLEAALNGSGEVGLVYVDVDRFKQVNDSLGHAGGDVVLAQLFDRIAAAVDGDGVIGRTGGDEFILLVQGPGIRARVDALTEMMSRTALEPFTVQGRAVHVSCSTGAVIGRKGVGETATEAAERLVREADEQMYASKRRKRAGRLLETDLDVIEVGAELHRAVVRDEITAQFQPQFDATTGRVLGFEVLARWHHPRFGPVPPDLFIPLAEDTGLIGALGDRILHQAFEFAHRASARGAIQISVNLSAQQMLIAGFVDRFAQLLGRYQMRTWAVTAEIAEGHFVTDHAVLADVLIALRGLDVDIAIDHFGTGQSSLALLQELPVTAIKIDKSFVRRMGALGGGMIGAIVNLARGLDLAVMVEGVDQPDQYAVLQRFGCDRLQGFLLAPPMDPEEALSMPLFIPLPHPGRDDAALQDDADLRVG